MGCADCEGEGQYVYKGIGFMTAPVALVDGEYVYKRSTKPGGSGVSAVVGEWGPRRRRCFAVNVSRTYVRTSWPSVAVMRMSVDLPAPLGPSNPYMPSGMVSVTSSSAFTPFG